MDATRQAFNWFWDSPDRRTRAYNLALRYKRPWRLGRQLRQFALDAGLGVFTVARCDWRKLAREFLLGPP